MQKYVFIFVFATVMSGSAVYAQGAGDRDRPERPLPSERSTPAPAQTRESSSVGDRVGAWIDHVATPARFKELDRMWAEQEAIDRRRAEPTRDSRGGGRESGADRGRDETGCNRMMDRLDRGARGGR